ncbi:MAG: hypothetical protein FJ245_07630 [Nitrospira sp.]|nr:hypothetical protein [Nitrospira sp.]
MTKRQGQQETGLRRWSPRGTTRTVGPFWPSCAETGHDFLPSDDIDFMDNAWEYVAAGRYELFKSLREYDGRIRREQHNSAL